MRGRVITAAALVAYALLTVLVWRDLAGIDRFDEAVSADASAFARRHEAWRTAMRLITHTGDTVPLLIGAALMVGVLIWRRRRRQALFVTAAVAIVALLSRGVKASVARPRPEERLTGVSGWAFPSGHTTNAAVAALVLGMLFLPVMRATWRRVAVAGTLATWALLVGVSRVALVVHWPIDLVGGWLAAAGAVGLATLLTRPSEAQGSPGAAEPPAGTGSPGATTRSVNERRDGCVFTPD